MYSSIDNDKHKALNDTVIVRRFSLQTNWTGKIHDHGQVWSNKNTSNNKVDPQMMLPLECVQSLRARYGIFNEVSMKEKVPTKEFHEILGWLDGQSWTWNALSFRTQHGFFAYDSPIKRYGQLLHPHQRCFR
ncbi:hypothetical protein SADUNF_Sadunf06G0215700 [Salix dunnii]|uniref:Uncharacterized protein n=1 Tax=Salix dunnii TaxID=1413687 RepID=A0A835K2V4_9ROSI|nr:hypothetical protein SADUNF_Sadunf06G0215700 [Salix dunnii]